jgi:hypothetical protein
MDEGAHRMRSPVSVKIKKDTGRDQFHFRIVSSCGVEAARAMQQEDSVWNLPL